MSILKVTVCVAMFAWDLEGNRRLCWTPNNLTHDTPLLVLHSDMNNLLYSYCIISCTVRTYTSNSTNEKGSRVKLIERMLLSLFHSLPFFCFETSFPHLSRDNNFHSSLFMLHFYSFVCHLRASNIRQL